MTKNAKQQTTFAIIDLLAEPVYLKPFAGLMVMMTLQSTCRVCQKEIHNGGRFAVSRFDTRTTADNIIMDLHHEFYTQPFDCPFCGYDEMGVVPVLFKTEQMAYQKIFEMIDEHRHAKDMLHHVSRDYKIFRCPAEAFRPPEELPASMCISMQLH